MARIEKRYDKRGKLKWARGSARDIFKDDDVSNSKCVYFRLSNPRSRWFCAMLPQHLATWETEGPPTPERIEEVHSSIPPFKKWRFVLLTVDHPKKDYTCLATVIEGDRLIEVAISRAGQPNINGE